MVLTTRYSPLNFQGRYRSSRRAKFFFLPLCFAFAVFIINVTALQHATLQNSEERLIKDEDVISQDDGFAERYRIKYNTTEDIKYILLWTPQKTSLFYNLGNGRHQFAKNMCKFTNCFVTSDRKYFGGDITKFDAIAINGQNIRYIQPSDLPQQRLPFQKIIFFNVESSTYQPVCNPWFDGFFNWTSTYKLNSDIVYSYIYIRNSKGEPVGPRIDMEWITDMKEVDEEFKNKLNSKTKAAAWFVSHCITRSRREQYVRALQKALKAYNLTVDVYGGCGTIRCPPRQDRYCNFKVETDYYFYLSFENAFAEDYVTEKLLTALNHNAVPIVYGGSNYSRFLPPGSYIDARQHDPEKLAAMMAHLMSTPSEYHEFFRWRNHYSYSESERVEDVCNVCAALNNRTMVMTQSVYEHFRSWWNPDWEERCQNNNWST